ncbi:unnamed protein product [Ectocarpus sp. 6 AP-2014]
MSVLCRTTLLGAAHRTARNCVRQRIELALVGNLEQQQHQHQQRRSMASNRSERLTVHQKKKMSRALVRARRLRNASMATVLGEEEWSGYEATMRQGLRELDDTTEVKRRGTYASKPLVSAAPQADKNDDGRLLSERDAWAERMEGVWNEILQADAKGTRPRITLPGFPIHVVMVKIARDYGHHKIFWELSDVDTRPPNSVLRQLYEARKQGFNARAVVVKSTAERLRKYEGYLRANLARRVPMRRVPEVRWQHVSEMPMSLQIEL